MLAVDTNVLIRFLTRDDEVQSPLARRLLSENDVWAPVTVVLEAEWVLRSSYGYRADEFADAISALAGLPRFEIQHGDEVDRALALHREGMDFAEALHLALSRGCSEFATFDRGCLATARRLGLAVRTP
jgi:predicted nucleic-acid-binding protein